MSTAYLAGFFDAEGCIGIGTQKKGALKRHQAKAVVANSDPAALLAFRSAYGGRLVLQKQATAKHSEQWIWVLDLGADCQFASDMLRYSITKRSQLLVAQEFCKTLRYGQKLTAEQKSHRAALKDKLEALNAGAGDELPQQVDHRDLAYAAGVFDGDGTVTLRKQSKASRGGRTYYVAVSVYMAHSATLEWLKAMFGGAIHPNYRGKRAKEWVTSCANAVAFLEAIQPYLVQKKLRVETALEIKALTAAPQSLKKRGLNNGLQFKDDSVVLGMERIKARLLEMNQLGPQKRRVA